MAVGPVSFFAFMLVSMIVVGTVALHWKLIAFVLFLLAALGIGVFL